MAIDPTDPAIPERAILDEIHDVIMKSYPDARQCFQIRQDPVALFQNSARELSKYERMNKNQAVLDKVSELRVPARRRPIKR